MKTSANKGRAQKRKQTAKRKSGAEGADGRKADSAPRLLWFNDEMRESFITALQSEKDRRRAEKEREYQTLYMIFEKMGRGEKIDGGLMVSAFESYLDRLLTLSRGELGRWLRPDDFVMQVIMILWYCPRYILDVDCAVKLFMVARAVIGFKIPRKYPDVESAALDASFWFGELRELATRHINLNSLEFELKRADGKMDGMKNALRVLSKSLIDGADSDAGKKGIETSRDGKSPIKPKRKRQYTKSENVPKEVNAIIEERDKFRDVCYSETGKQFTLKRFWERRRGKEIARTDGKIITIGNYCKSSFDELKRIVRNSNARRSAAGRVRQGEDSRKADGASHSR